MLLLHVLHYLNGLGVSFSWDIPRHWGLTKCIMDQGMDASCLIGREGPSAHLATVHFLVYTITVDVVVSCNEIMVQNGQWYSTIGPGISPLNCSMSPTKRDDWSHRRTCAQTQSTLAHYHYYSNHTETQGQSMPIRGSLNGTDGVLRYSLTLLSTKGLCHCG